MARYFFHLHDRSGRTEDEQGREVADLSSLRTRAVKAARSIIQADAGGGVIDLTARIEVANEAGETVLALSFAEAVDLITAPAAP
jgi:hypothetical protein